MPSTVAGRADRRSRTEQLRRALPVPVHVPGDPAYDTLRLPWNLAVEQRPAAVTLPTTTSDVAAVVRAATGLGLRVAAQATGHNAGPLPELGDVVLLRTDRMTSIDVVPAPDGLRLRVGAGTLWQDAVDAAARVGTSVLHGSSPDVGVVGYSLGGGLGWYARRLGLATNSVTGAEVVLADGTRVWADDEHESELFWALRGGGGNAGVVTRLEFRTYPFTTAYAGMLVWDARRIAEVLPRWASWAVGARDSVTTSFRRLHLPPVPEVPAPFRGRELVIVDGAVLEDDDVASEVIAPLRGLRPDMDTFARVPTNILPRLHMDPETPTAGVSGSTVLERLPGAAVDVLLGTIAAGGPAPLPLVELRQLGGALARPAPDAGVMPLVPGQFVLFAGAPAMTSEAAADGRRAADALVRAMQPWSTGRPLLNFTESPIDAGAAFDPDLRARLHAVRRAVDPDGVLVANHPVTPVGVASPR